MKAVIETGGKQYYVEEGTVLYVEKLDAEANSKVTFDEERCKGCGLCETVCPKQIIMLSKEKINAKGYHPAVVTDSEKCIGCAFCATMCPDTVITVEK